MHIADSDLCTFFHSTEVERNLEVGDLILIYLQVDEFNPSLLTSYELVAVGTEEDIVIILLCKLDSYSWVIIVRYDLDTEVIALLRVE